MRTTQGSGSLIAARFSEDWIDCTDTYRVGACIATGGGGYWPCMVSLDGDLEGTITADDARALAAMLVRAADACDAETLKERGDV